MEGQAVGHKFEKGSPKDYPIQVWSTFLQWFQRHKQQVMNIVHTAFEQIS